MSSEQGVPSPAAAVLARRQGRTTPQKRAQVQVSSGGESETGSETGQTSSGMQTMIRFVTMDTMKTRVVGQVCVVGCDLTHSCRFLLAWRTKMTGARHWQQGHWF